MMDVRVLVPKNRESHTAHRLFDFMEGLRRHGITPTETTDQTRPCDLFVVWNHRAVRSHATQRAAGKPYLVLEMGYVGDRFVHTAAGFNGLNGRATFPACLDSGERWDRLFAQHEREQFDGGDFILLMGQVPGDASIAHVDINEWYRQVVDAYADSDLPVRFRAHPKADGARVTGAELIGGDLADAVKSAAFVVTFNSNSGVDAVLAGRPAITFDRGAMAWPVTDHRLGEIPVHHDRTAWRNRLAWCQWTSTELADGSAWEALKTCL